MSDASHPRGLAAAAFAALGLALAPPARAAETLYVHNTMSGEISKIAIPEHRVVGTIEVGLYMDYLAASPDGRILYANRIESLGLPGVAPNVGESGELIAIDTQTDRFLWRVSIDGMTHHMSVSKDGRLVFVPLWDSFWLAVIDTETRSVAKKIYVGHGGHGSKLSADGKRLYVGSMMIDQIVVVDTERLEVVRRIGFEDAVRPFVLTRDERRMYVQLSRFHGFAVVNPLTGQRLATVPLPTLGRDVRGQELYPHNVNHGLALSPDESLLLANGSAIDTVVMFSHPDLEPLATIPVGRDPNAVAFSRDGRFAYVSNRGSDDLSVIDVARREETTRLKLGRYPQRMVVVDVPAAGGGGGR